MANTAGNRWILFIGASPSPTTRLTKVKNLSRGPTTRTADAETNEDGGSEAHDIIGDGGEDGFDLQVDSEEPSHTTFLNLYKNRQKVYVKIVERGDVDGAESINYRASISLRPAAPIGGLITYAVTLKKDGAVTYGTHSV